MNETTDSPKDIIVGLLTALAKSFTEHHDLLEITSTLEGDRVVVRWIAHPDDAAKIIGKGGGTFYAMKTIGLCATAKLGFEFHLTRIKDQSGETKDPNPKPPQYHQNWPRDEIGELIRTTCENIFEGNVLVEWVTERGSESTANVSVGAAEKFAVPQEQLEDSLSTVFNAIGHVVGRKIYVKLRREENHNRTGANVK